MEIPASQVLKALVLLTAVPILSSAQVVTVSSPANNSQFPSPAHYVASGASLRCPQGIIAMRIYLAPHVVAYEVQSNSIDTQLPLAPGNYKTVVQAWDACGGVGKAAVNFTVTPNTLKPARFLYGADTFNFRVMGYTVNPATGVLKPTAQRSVSVPITSQARIAANASGSRLYVTNGLQTPGSGRVFGFFIDRRNGHLSPVPGSPITVNASGFTGPITVHPSGRFVFVGMLDLGGIVVCRVNADGSLTALNSTPIPTQGSLRSLIADPSGKYLYALSDLANSIDAFAIDTISGSLTPLPGSPWIIYTHNCNPEPTDMTDLYGRFLYAADLFGSALSAYTISASTGTLAKLPGSPYPVHGGCPNLSGPPLSISVEPSGRFLYAYNPTSGISLFSINAGDGVLNFVQDFHPPFTYFGPSYVRGDPSGKFLYVAGPLYNGQLLGLSINPSTGLVSFLPGSPFPMGAQLYDFVVTP
jgi:hypothetical protein